MSENPATFKNDRELLSSGADVWRQFVATVKSAYNIAGCAVVLFALVIASVVWVAISSTELMVSVVLLLVLLVGLVVYVSTGKYGEAALALVGGLLTAYSVAWTPRRFIAFVAVWAGFTFIALLIASVKLAGKSESIYRQAAVALVEDFTKTRETEKVLRAIGEKREYGILGPIERAEVIRLFVFRKLPLDVMPTALRFVANLSVITRIEFLTVADFIADVYRIFEITTPGHVEVVIDLVYNAIRRTAAPPADFFIAFAHSRRLVLTGALDPFSFFPALQTALEAGVKAEAVGEYLERRLNTQPPE
jgi:hypothetical protein